MTKNNIEVKKIGAKIRKWSRTIHRDLSFFFSGIIVIYAISGIALNHKRDFNPSYSISRQELTLSGKFPMAPNINEQAVNSLLKQIDEQNAYAKHYYYEEQKMKVFLKGGSSLDVNMNTGNAIYEKLQKRPILNTFNRLHMNPNRWWTWFSDIFAISLLIITVTGIIMLKGPKGFWGRGGIEFGIGILIPILFLLFLL
nr:PepSY-associated TM helix domain-containing protein [Dysgonomonas sp. BGC7]